MMALKPEQLARQKIDALLTAAGWVLQDKDQFNRNAALGVAVREFQLPAGPCDYLLFIDGRAAGVLEAKPQGVTLTGVAEQADKYMEKLPPHIARWADNLLFDYESTGDETLFRFMRDPHPRSRRVFAFHKPETMKAWLEDESTLRARLAQMPPLIKTGLRDCQVEAIEGLEQSLAQDLPRSLIQMATGAGKTFTACNFSYRLVRHAKAKRILFLVDRTTLGDQTLSEYQRYFPPGEAHKFTDLYNVQHLRTNAIDPVNKVVITTIQRLYAMLCGEELDPLAEEVSAFESGAAAQRAREVEYNPAIPIEMFDIIVTDECHRSIYGTWRQVLEYFDAHIIGLTATPGLQTLGYFNKNLVAEYPYERSVVDGVNVGYEIYRIKTQVSTQGGKVEKGFSVGVMDRRTRKVRYEELEEDLSYIPAELNRSVTVPNQIRLVLETYRDQLKADLFPGRESVPKTLIFAQDDNHAEQIVTIAREVFGQGNDFAKKITYRTTGESPKELLQRFRVDAYPRIAVTVDMIATGTDVRAIEVLIFMRDVRSGQYFEQMKGRGARIIQDSDLMQVSPGLRPGERLTKTKFILVDAVGVTESIKQATKPLERKRTVPFDKLLERIAGGYRDTDNLSSLAGRLAALAREVDEEDTAQIAKITNGATLKDLANRLLTAIEPDEIMRAAEAAHGPAPTETQIQAVEAALKDNACGIFDQPAVRQILVDIKKKHEIVIDSHTIDKVLGAEFSQVQAEATRSKFKEFLDMNKDELLALQILYNRPYKTRRLTYAAVKDLSEAMGRTPWLLDPVAIWHAYKRLESDRVREASAAKTLTDIIALVRYAIGHEQVLEPFKTQVIQRFNLWLGREKKAGRNYSPEQLQWLELIRDHVAANAEVTADDLQSMPSFTTKGGLLKARQVFGGDIRPMLETMNEVLVA